jgi:hypothetical protein
VHLILSSTFTCAAHSEIDLYLCTSCRVRPLLMHLMPSLTLTCAAHSEINLNLCSSFGFDLDHYFRRFVPISAIMVMFLKMYIFYARIAVLFVTNCFLFAKLFLKW